MDDVWEQGDAYERFMGRWSRLVAPLFLDWLDAPGGQRWADVGCGSGALTSAILQQSSPARVLALDPSEAQVGEASRHIHDPRVSFGVGTASSLPARSFDAVVSGLVLNFVPDPVAAVVGYAAGGPGRHGRGVRVGLRLGHAAAAHVLGRRLLARPGRDRPP